MVKMLGQKPPITDAEYAKDQQPGAGSEASRCSGARRTNQTTEQRERELTHGSDLGQKRNNHHTADRTDLHVLRSRHRSAVSCSFSCGSGAALSLPVMQRSYLADYVRASAGALAHQTGEYRLIYLDGPKKAQPRRALPVDFGTEQRYCRTATCSQCSLQNYLGAGLPLVRPRRSAGVSTMRLCRGGYASPSSRVRAFRACSSSECDRGRSMPRSDALLFRPS